MNANLPDAEARMSIVRDLDYNMVVEAGAGSGKTQSLVDRMMALIATNRARMENIAAVTFTRKAAAEMRKRFQLALEEKVAKAVDSEQKELFQKALSTLEQAFIGTIHSFCARLLRERPIEAGIDPSFRELDELANSRILEDSWNSYLAGMTNEEQANRLRALENLGISVSDLKSAFLRICDYPDVEIAHRPVDAPDLSAAVEKIKQFIEEAEPWLPEEHPVGGWDDLQKCVLRGGRMFRNIDMASPRNIVELLRLFARSPRFTQSKWRDRVKAKYFGQKYQELRDKIVDPTLTRWREFCHDPVVRFVESAARYAREYRLSRGWLNYQDLLMEAAKLLRERPEVRSYFKRRFTHILVDEFQDTDPIQAEVIFFLCCEEKSLEEKDWRNVVLERGRLFIVGDPKQSIYRFRRADIFTYNKVKELVRKHGGRICTLTSNFRANTEIGGWVTSAFKDVFPKEATDQQPAFAPVEAFRKPHPDAKSGVYKLMVSDSGKKGKDKEVDKKVADMVARVILEAVSEERGWKLADKKNGGVLRPVQPGDIMILTTKRAPISLYAGALERYGIPYEITGAEIGGEETILRELVLLAEAVADPEDPVKLVGVLRGPLFGVSDDDLYRFKRAGGKFSFLFSPPENTPERIREALSRMERYWKWTREVSPICAFEKIIDDLGVIPFEASQPLGMRRGGLVLQLLELARGLPPEEAFSFSMLTDQLRRLVESGAVADANYFTGGENVVRVMNLHKAKGLEAGVVFLVGSFGKWESKPEFHVDRTGESPKGYFAFYSRPDPKRKEALAQPPGWENISEIEKKFLDAERSRLHYVAATRAADVLVVCGVKGKESEESFWGVLLSQIPDDREIVVPEVPVGQQEQEEVVVSVEKLNGARRVREERERFVRIQSFGRTSVVKESECALRSTRPLTEGRGASWGRVLHCALEAFGKGITGKQLEKLISNRLAYEERPPSELAEVMELLRKIETTELWRRMLRAKEKLFEVPFTILTTAGELGQKDAPADRPVVLTGQIDLVFKEKDGWVIVDYKTGASGANTDELSSLYSRQMELYAKYWEKVTQEPVSEVHILPCS